MLSSFFTYLRLGLLNLFRVAIYRVACKTKFISFFLSNDSRIIKGPIFESKSLKLFIDTDLKEPYKLFDQIPLKYDQKIDWSKNYLSGKEYPANNKPWYEINEFSLKGDIKGIWEPSRFDWIIDLVIRHLNGCRDSLNEANKRIIEWQKHNPAYIGPNWKCAQECSIRLLNIIYGKLLLNDLEPNESSNLFFLQHLKRIKLTTLYSKAQNNNHALSEAAALLMGGHFLSQTKIKDGIIFKNIGRNLLEERISKLVLDDGTFSQYSTNYQRMVIDIVTMCELWRIRNDEPKFSDEFYKKTKKMINWLYQLLDIKSGEVPNLGANDGTRLFKFSNNSYSDYRHSVDLACSIFFRKKIFESNLLKQIRALLMINEPNKMMDKQKSFCFREGGFLGLRNQDSLALIRVPNYKFRPSQCDALHLDFFNKGQNIFRDSGTFSYNQPISKLNNFDSVLGHNTIQFDDEDQMPRISRFLYGNWLKYSNLSFSEKAISVRYKEKNLMHKRSVFLEKSKLKVVDEVFGFKKNAILRWHLKLNDWQINGNEANCEEYIIKISSTSKIYGFEIKKGFESKIYSKMDENKILETKIKKPGKITTILEY
mgnify:CR=1 FL=1|tara:strand:+ start:8890 stop:10674 length:1785 start_codon:yes stop_codon:yes gene_type:complete